VLDAMAAAEGLSLAGLIARIDAERGMSLLASACRVRALRWTHDRST
jgi:predicted DNA-binding ribbon-helix-helix protein